jgi:heme oxygenase
LLPLAAGAVRAKASWSFSAHAPVQVVNEQTVGAPPHEPKVPMSLRITLRNATAVDHQTVDGEFGRFDLSLPSSYSKFLIAHARVLGAIEGAVSGIWSPWRARFPLLKADLAELGIAVMEGLPLPTDSLAGQWGALYVLEGSRLGGGILASRVGNGLPKRYLSATHEAGSWRRFSKALDDAEGSDTEVWRADAITGAKLAFACFARSAADVN